MNWHPGIVGGIAVLIAIGLVLKFGGSSTALVKGIGGATTNETNALLMSGLQGNNPPGVTTA